MDTAHEFKALRPREDDDERRMQAMIEARLFGRSRDARDRIGRFTIVERLGQGGMGTVYAAYSAAGR